MKSKMKVKIQTVDDSDRFQDVTDELPESSQDVEDDDGGTFVTETCFICDQKASIMDSSTNLIAYCSKEHQKLHENSEDLDDEGDDTQQVYPFLVKYKPGLGRYMVAARDIEAGELIFRDSPLAIGPNHSEKPSCLDCMRKVEGSYFCCNCNFPVCDEMCALGDEHSQQECQVFSKLNPKLQVKDIDENDPKYWSITVLRILLLKHSDPNKFAMVRRMVDHVEEHRNDIETWKLYKDHVVDFLRFTCNLKDTFTEEEIFHVLGAIDVNSVKIHCSKRGSESQYPGHALYPITALLSHSCVCNSKTLIDDSYRGECRATTFIKKGEEVTKQYVSPLETTNMRREKLKDGWYFDCCCQRCSDPTELDAYCSVTSCLRCQGGNILPRNPLDPKSDWFCDCCQFKTNGAAVDKLVDYFLDKIKSLGPESIDDWEELMEKALKMFHPNHYVLNIIRINLNTHYIRLSLRVGMDANDVPVEVFMRRKDLLDEVHRVISIVEPGLTRRRGISLFETSTCHLQIGKLLHESKRFPTEDFIQLCQAEIESLKDCIRCLEHFAEGSGESEIHYKAKSALYEAEYTLRLLEIQQQNAGERD